MDPNNPYRQYYSSSTAQMAGGYSTTSMAPAGSTGSVGGAVQQQQIGGNPGIEPQRRTTAWKPEWIGYMFDLRSTAEATYNNNNQSIQFERLRQMMKARFGEEMTLSAKDLEHGWSQFVRPTSPERWPHNLRRLPAGTRTLPAQGSHETPPPSHGVPPGAFQSAPAGQYGGSLDTYANQYGATPTAYTTAYGGHGGGFPNLSQTRQRGYGDDEEAYLDPSTGLRPGVVPNVYNTFSVDRTSYPRLHGVPQPGHGGQYVPTADASNTFPGPAAVEEPASQGSYNDALGAPAPQPCGVEDQPVAPGGNIQDGWSVREHWVYNQGLRLDGVRYKMADFQRDYNKCWGRVSTKGEALFDEYKSLWEQCHGGQH